MQDRFFPLARRGLDSLLPGVYAQRFPNGTRQHFYGSASGLSGLFQSVQLRQLRRYSTPRTLNLDHGHGLSKIPQTGSNEISQRISDSFQFAVDPWIQKWWVGGHSHIQTKAPQKNSSVLWECCATNPCYRNYILVASLSCFSLETVCSETQTMKESKSRWGTASSESSCRCPQPRPPFPERPLEGHVPAVLCGRNGMPAFWQWIFEALCSWQNEYKGTRGRHQSCGNLKQKCETKTFDASQAPSSDLWK